MVIPFMCLAYFDRFNLCISITLPWMACMKCLWMHRRWGFDFSFPVRLYPRPEVGEKGGREGERVKQLEFENSSECLDSFGYFSEQRLLHTFIMWHRVCVGWRCQTPSGKTISFVKCRVSKRLAEVLQVFLNSSEDCDRDSVTLPT